MSPLPRSATLRGLSSSRETGPLSNRDQHRWSRGNGGTSANYEQARKQARAEGKQLFVEFSASWCGPCQRMKQTTFTDSGVRDELSRYVEVFLDADSTRDLAQKFGIRGIPAYLVLTADETVILRGSGYRGPREFRTWLAGGG